MLVQCAEEHRRSISRITHLTTWFLTRTHPQPVEISYTNMGEAEMILPNFSTFALQVSIPSAPSGLPPTTLAGRFLVGRPMT